MIRENPWHLRRPQAQHYQWFKNLVDLHELSLQWIKDVQVDRPAHFLTRGMSPEIAENLWMLDSLSQTPLDQLLDDTTPGDLLGRLEKTIWTVQAWTLHHILNQSSETQIALESLLQQSSWKAGKKCCESRWKDLPQLGTQDLETVLLALQDSPFSGFPHSPRNLVKRSTSHEIQIELRACPHQLFFPEIKPFADTLCQLHAHWCRGFGHALNHRTSIEHSVQTPRCFQRWFFG